MVKLSQKPIAVTSLKIGGSFDERKIEGIGMVLFDQSNFMILDSMDVQVRPENENDLRRTEFEKTFPKERNWKGTAPLKEAIGVYTQKTKGAIFCSYDVTPDWILLSEAFVQAKTEHNMDNIRIDLLSIAWEKVLKDQDDWSLEQACGKAGIPLAPESESHIAFSRAEVMYHLFKALENASINNN